jgi:molybdopterin biosynthesis enzyme
VAERDADGSPARDDQGRVRVRLAGGQAGQGSHVMSALAAADAFAVVPEAHDRLDAGAAVELWWLDLG